MLGRGRDVRLHPSGHSNTDSAAGQIRTKVLP
jgi:hypothetical protein